MSQPITVTVCRDTAASPGPIKPLHGVNSGPVSYFDGENWGYDASDLFREAGIHRVRTHDTEYPFGAERFVDIPCIFPNFSLDADDPANYYFRDTDNFLAKVTACGAKILYRLGVTIEHQRVKRFIYPPTDYAKWANICAHIIRHYTQGWADGFYYKDIFWEIWNEPECETSMWLGDVPQFLELYRVAACALKKEFPNEIIGGFASCGFWQGKYTTPFAEMLAADPDIPLDFFSWHVYTKDPREFQKGAALIETIKAAAKRPDALSVLDEYNYVEDWGDIDVLGEWVANQHGGAFTAASLMAMQDSPVWEANYYSAQAWSTGDPHPAEWVNTVPQGTRPVFNGIYQPKDGKVTPLPGFYAMRDFNKLYRLGTQLACSVEGSDQFYAIAATDGRESLLFYANYSAETVEAVLDGKNVTLAPWEFGTVAI